MKLKIMILAFVFGLMFVGVGAYAQTSQNETNPSENTTDDRRVGPCVDGAGGACNPSESNSNTTVPSDKNTRQVNQTSDRSTTRMENNQEAKTMAESVKERAKVKLESKKLEVCKKKQDVMKNTMIRMGDRASKHIAWLDSVFTKVKTFYSEKGLVVSNYDELVSNVETARTAAVSSQTQLSQYQTEFNCEGDDPKAVIEDFKTQHQSQVDAIKAYKESLKTLVTAIKAVAPKDNVTSNGQNGGAN